MNIRYIIAKRKGFFGTKTCLSLFRAFLFLSSLPPYKYNTLNTALQNPSDGRGQMCRVRGVGHHATSPHRMWGGTGYLGKDPHTDSASTNNWPETCIHGMAPSSLFRTMASTKASDVILDFVEYVFLFGASTQKTIGNGIYWIHASDAMEDISEYK